MKRLGHTQSTVPILRGVQLNRTSPHYQGLVSAWLYNNSAYTGYIADLVGINDAAISGTRLWQETDNELGGGIYTAGDASGYTDAGNHPSLQITSGGLTLSIWVRFYQTLSGGNFPGLLCKGDSDGAATLQNFQLYLTAGVRINLVLCSGSSVTSVQNATNLSDMQATYHIAATWQPSTRASVFYNGRRDGTSTTSIPATINNANYNLFIGSMQGGATLGKYQFRGVIHEARIYNRALSEDEIYQLWTPPTRWDLYRSPQRFFGAAPAAPAGRVYGPAVQ